MAELKNKENNASVQTFLKTVEDKQKYQDCLEILKIMRDVSGKRAKMWGTSMVGFGRYHYKYKSGHEGDWFVTGFSPRKQSLTIYIMPGFSKYKTLMDKLGKHKTAKSCLYIKRLDDVNTKVLKQLISRSIKDMQKMYKCG